jgi:outer membrane protein assembly factor BamA
MRTRVRCLAIALCLAGLGSAPAASDSTSTRRLTVVPFPFYFYSPETKSGGGVSVSVFTRDRSREENRPNSYSLLTLYTQRKQFVLGLGAEFYRSQERYRFGIGFNLSDFPNTFFGIGPRVDDDGEDYTERSLEFLITASQEFDSQWRLGPSVGFTDQELSDFESDGLLIAGIRGSEGGQVVMLGFGAERDLRDNVVYARHGEFVRLEWGSSLTALGSDYDFHTASLDVRRYRSLGPWVWALRATAAAAFDQPPFQALPGVGGDSILRGYYEDRFRERRLYSLQNELRVNDWRRLGLVLFVDSGDVSRGIDEFSLDTIKVSYGLGLRILLSRAERLQIRADFGAGDDGSSGLYLNLGEAF